jgi:hypothetical protein
VKAKSGTARIAALRELLDRGYGRPRQAVEVSAPAGDPLQELFEEIDALNRKRIYKQVPSRLMHCSINAWLRTTMTLAEKLRNVIIAARWP